MLIVTYKPFMLSVVMQNVVMLRVVAPRVLHFRNKQKMIRCFRKGLQGGGRNPLNPKIKYVFNFKKPKTFFSTFLTVCSV
jgi:hypothetical protein